MRLIAIPGIVACLTACGEAPAPEKEKDMVAIAASDKPKKERPANVCKGVTFEEVKLTHCIADPERHTIRTVLGPAGGKPYRGLGRFAEHVAEKQPKVIFATNGGMFNDEGQPIGYYVESGKRLKKVNTNEGPGNFHLLPNGIFFGDDQEWNVLASPAFVETIEERPFFGTQSGPMLVVDGQLHPRIAKNGESRLIRNAVGVDDDGKAHFVISEMPISFGKLARFYRDKLAVGNALYLDGTVSALYNPAVARIDASPPLGPLIVVEKRAKAAPDDPVSGEGGTGSDE